MKPNIIYILGTGHSGSTILQYILSGQPNTIGIGEVRHIRSSDWSKKNQFCSCGEKIADCPMWGDLEPKDFYKDRDWYKCLVKKACELYPFTSHIVDSSKSLQSISQWYDLERENIISSIKIIYLVRDVRGWVMSDQTRRKRKNRPSMLLFLSILSWWKSQKSFLHYLQKNADSVEYLIVSYESIVFQTQKQLHRIMDFCNTNVDPIDCNVSLENAVVHDVKGNRITSKPEKRKSLTYDDRWQYRLSNTLMLPILFPVWRLNSLLRSKGGIYQH